MPKKFISLVLSVFLLLALLVGCNNKTLPLENEQQIDDKQQIVDGEQQKGDNEQKVEFDLKTVEKYLDESGRYDFRGQDLSNLAILDLEPLVNFVLDTQTKFPNNFLDTYDFEKAVDYGKDPGLNILSLHNEGITGKGVNVAVIDGVLLKEHNEIKDSIVLCEDLVDNETAFYHGTPITSILCGKEVGIAPEAKVYFVSYINDKLYNSEDYEEPYVYLAKAIERIVEINKELPQEEKIRVLSISSGWDPNSNKSAAIVSAIDKAKEDGIFVVTARLYDHDGLYFGGASREILSDPNDFNSYSANYLDTYKDAQEILLAPMDARWLASHIGEDDYVMYRRGAWSMVIPYISGVYTLACQIYPEITPNLFWELALSTGYDVNENQIDSEFTGKTVKIINPTNLIKELKNR